MNILKRTALLLSACYAAFSYSSTIYVDGSRFAEKGTVAEPFTSIHSAYLGAVKAGFGAGNYHFNIGGQVFSTLVDENGYVLVIAGDSSSSNAYTQVTALAANSDSILTQAIVEKLTKSEINEVLLTTPDKGLVATSTSESVITNLSSYVTLPNTNTAPTAWTETTSGSHLNATCTGSPGQSLASGFIYQACGNTTGLHWNSSNGGDEEIDLSNVTSDSLQLWVRGNDLLAESGSAGKPFTSLGKARAIMLAEGFPAGVYNFNIDGVTFSTYINASGEVLVAIANKDTNNGNYTTTTALTNTVATSGDQLLSSAVLAKFTSAVIDSVKITSTTTSFTAKSSAVGVINALSSFQTLPNQHNGGNWAQLTGGSNRLNANCTGSDTTLNENIYHGCGFGSSMHWLPTANLEGITTSTKEDLKLWVLPKPDLDQSGTALKPFTSIGAARYVISTYGLSASTYHFNIDGQAFSTYVDADGYVMVVTANKNTSNNSAYAQTTNLTVNSDSTLSAAVFAKLTSSQINVVRMTAPADGFIAESIHANVINAITGFLTLPNQNSGGNWTQITGASNRTNATCGGSTGTLAQFIYHGCGLGSSMHWLPANAGDFEGVTATTGSRNELKVWVRGTSVTVPFGQTKLSNELPETGDGLSWSTAFVRLQSALAIAANGDDVWVAKGVYTPSITGDVMESFNIASGVSVYGGFTGGETLLSAAAPKTNAVVLSGDLETNDTNTSAGVTTASSNIVGNNSAHVVVFNNSSGAKLQGVTVTAGNASPQTDSRGGGIQVTGTTSPAVQLNEVILQGNQAKAGGALLVSGSSTVELADAAITNNKANDNYGGGVLVDGSTAVINVKRALFLTNAAEVGAGGSPALGGGLAAISGATASLVNSTVTGNSATDHGGALAANGAGASITCNYCTIINNTITAAAGSSGRNIVARDSANVTLSRSVVANDDTATTTHHDIYSESGGSITDGGYNSVGINNVSAVTSFASVFNSGTSFINTMSATNAMLNTTLGDDGGITQTLPVRTDSTLRNAIPAAQCGTVVDDQRKKVRPETSGEACDIGAVEIVPLATCEAGRTASSGNGTFCLLTFGANGTELFDNAIFSGGRINAWFLALLLLAGGIRLNAAYQRKNNTSN